MDKVWTVEEIKKNIMSSRKWVEQGVLAIYNKQTAEEKSDGEAIEDNGIGFSGAHACSGTYYAKWLLQGKHLSGKHLNKARDLILHYTKQLTKIANHKI